MLIAFKPKLTMLVVVTQDSDLALELTQQLKPQGYQVEWAESADLALDLLARFQPEFILLDWRMPGPDAQLLCRRIRRTAAGAAIHVVALCGKNHAADRVQALEAGVNDYLTEPFTPEDLLASMEALQSPQVVVPFVRELKAGEINMALDRRVVYVSGKAVELTHKEFRLLEELLSERGRVLTREVLLARIWRHTNVDKLHTRTVDIHISRLRQKLGYSGNNIITVRNVGYRTDIAPEWINHTERPRNSN